MGAIGRGFESRRPDHFLPIGQKMVNEAARLHFTAFAACRKSSSLKSRRLFFTSSQNHSRLACEVAPLRGTCAARRKPRGSSSPLRSLVKTFASLTCEVCSLCEQGWCFDSPRGFAAKNFRSWIHAEGPPANRGGNSPFRVRTRLSTIAAQQRERRAGKP